SVPNDTATTTYVVQSGDLLGSIAKRYKVPYPFLELINGIDARRLRVGQSLKLIQGPIHARVDKSEFVMDVYVFGTDGTPAYLTSFPVGLGENDNTPLGKWQVARGKVTNPDWRNPRTNEYFPADHPNNPIGEYWVPITGLEGDAVGRTGFGIHGTNEPDSIGRNMSMGCIRLGDADIAMVFSMMEPGASEVLVVP
ncbi:MAG: L,D-transpeptidase family protein, partial [Planctomycetota bacterium]